MDSNKREGSAPLPTAKSKSTRKKFSSVGCRTGNWILPPSIPTLPSWMGDPFGDTLTLSVEDSPAQDLSVAGKQAGIDGERSGLWGEYARLIRQIRPRWVIVENVPGLLIYPGMSRVLGDLASSGYDAEWSCISAEEMGAPHKRERVWIIGQLADPQSVGSESGESSSGGEDQERGESSQIPTTGSCSSRGEIPDSHRAGLERGLFRGIPETQEKVVASRCGSEIPDPASIRPSGSGKSGNALHPETSEKGEATQPGNGSRSNVWGVECRLGRTPDGLPDGVDPDHECIGWECGVPRVAKGQKFRTPRLMGLGNAIVPQISTYLGYLILEMEKNSSPSWIRVKFAMECIPCQCCGEEPWCDEHDMHFAECDCVGPTQDGYDYREIKGIMYARFKEIPE